MSVTIDQFNQQLKAEQSWVKNTWFLPTHNNPFNHFQGTSTVDFWHVTLFHPNWMISVKKYKMDKSKMAEYKMADSKMVKSKMVDD